MPRYEFSEGTSNKFWEIKLDGTSFTTTYGKIGANGQTTIKSFKTEAEAKKEYDKLIAEKVKKGYEPAGGGAAAKAAAPAKTKEAKVLVDNPPVPLTKAAKASAAKASAAAAPAASSASGTPGARYFEFVEGTSSKFWEILLDGSTVTTRYGKIGTAGQQTEKDFDTRSEAFKEYDKLVAEKTKKGYVENTPGAAPADGAAAGDRRNPELEKAIFANPYDTDAYMVYADWLQDQGDPRGELIALQIGDKADAAQKLLAKHADYFIGPLADHQKTHDGEDVDAFTWKYGFIHALRLSHDSYGDEGFDGSLAEALDLLLRHPSGRFLTEITFVFNGDPNEDDLQSLIDLLEKRAPASLRKLHFGDFQYAGPSSPTATGTTEISWYSIGNLAKLWKAVPKLQTLITQCGSSESTISNVGMKLGTLELPELVHAEFRTGGLEKANAKAIAAGKFPKIEHLEIWYGDDNYGGDAGPKEVQLLLDRTDLPALRYLGLKNAVFTDELVVPLAKSKLLKQLEVLDLSMGCLTDAGAAEIAKHADAFGHLAKLDVSACYLTDAGIAALKGVAKRVVADEQREIDDPEDPESRYPSVAE